MSTHGPQFLTQTKHDELTKQLELLRTVKRKEIAERLENARSLGDLSENAEYHDARDAQADIEGEITHLELILKDAKIVSAHKTNEVTIGATVTIVKKGTRSEVEYLLVGSTEANAAERKLSSDSPLGKALLGAKVGATVTLKTPAGLVDYTITRIA